MRQAGSEVFSQRLASPWLAPLVTALVLVSLAASALAIWKLGPWNRDAAPPDPRHRQRPARQPAARQPMVPRMFRRLAGATAPRAPTDAARGAEPVPLSAAPWSRHWLDYCSDRTCPTVPTRRSAQLLKLWGATPSADGADACSAATRQGLECVSLRSTLAQLRELNRPAVLALSDDNRRMHQVVLTQLDDEHAWLRVGTQDIYVSIADLSRYWFGDLVLLWRPPATTVNRLARGNRGPAVQALRERLLRWSGVAPSAAPLANVFDADLQQRVEQFQLAHHLTADGKAGLDTQLLLDSVLAAPGSPQLRKSAPRG